MIASFLRRSCSARGLSGLGVLVAAALCKPVFAAPAYQVVEIPPLPNASSNIIRVESLNDLGQVIGKIQPRENGADRRTFLYSDGATIDITSFTNGSNGSGFLFFNNKSEIASTAFGLYRASDVLLRRATGEVQNLGSLGGTRSTVNQLTEESTVVGKSSLSGDATSHAFVWRNGSMTDLGTLGGTNSEAIAANNAGQIIGNSEIVTNTTYALTHGFLHQNGAMTDLGTFGGQQSSARAINGAGQIVGSAANSRGDYHAFLYQNGVKYDLTPYTTSGSASTINESGDIIGNLYELYNGSNVLHGFRCSGNNSIQVIAFAGGVSQTYGLNNAGQVVGYATDYNNRSLGYVFQNNRFYDLNTLIPNEGWSITSAIRINNHGQIVAYAQRDGIQHVLLLTPGDLPSANDDVVSAREDSQANIEVLNNDFDGQGRRLTISSVGQPQHGSVQISSWYPTPTLLYSPAANYNGPDSFTYTIDNGAGGTATATVNVTVTPVNDAPVAAAQSVTLDEDTTTAITLSASDVDGDTLSYAVVSAPSHGTLSGTAPNLVYTPTANYNGTDSFSFKASDGTANSNTATVNLSVLSVNDAPVSSTQSVTLDEDTTKGITLAASDVEGDALTYSVVTPPTKGTLSGSGANLVYTPNANFNGSDSFSFKANDGAADSNTATVNLSVLPMNDAPASSDQTVTTDEDTARAIMLSASDVDSDSLTYSVVNAPTHGTLSGNAPNLTYTPDTDYNGADSFTFAASDGKATSNATVSISVTPVNDAPVASGQSVTTDEDTARNITLIASDKEGDALTYSVTQPAHGTLSGTAPNLVYTPAANYNGADSFLFHVNDSSTWSNTATVSISVTSINDAPVAISQTVDIAEDMVRPITLIASDVERDPLTYAVVSAPTHGTLSGAAPNLTYTPVANYNGPDSFTFKANDGTSDSKVTTISISLAPLNDAPIALRDTASTRKNTAITISVTSNDSDVDGDVLTVTSVTQGANGTVALAGGGSVTYTPKRNFFGTDTFSYTISDGKGSTATATVTMTVTK